MALEERHNGILDNIFRATGLEGYVDEAVDNVVESQGTTDQLVFLALGIATDVQAWSMKPAQFGGKASHESLADATFEKVNPSTNQSVFNWASFSLETSNRCRTEPEIPSKKTIQIYVNAEDEKAGVRVCVGIAGQASTDVGYVVEP